jgi:hypothetical protein
MHYEFAKEADHFDCSTTLALQPSIFYSIFIMPVRLLSQQRIEAGHVLPI